MEIKGTMLLRDSVSGEIHLLMTDRLEQAQIQPIQLGDGTDIEVLRLEEQQFKDFVGVIKTLQVRLCWGELFEVHRSTGSNSQCP
eukprot:gene5575-5812_t